MSEPHASSLVDALRAALAALLDDRDVTRLELGERRGLVVVRRGRREGIAVELPVAVFDAAERAGVLEPGGAVSLDDDAWVTGARAADERRVLVEKRATPPVTMMTVLEEGVVDPEGATALMSALQRGIHVVVAGPARALRQRVAVALATECAPYLSVARIAPGGPRDVPLFAAKDDVVARAAAAAAQGAELVLALELAPRALAALVDAQPPVLIVASSSAPSVEGLDGRVESFAVGFGPAAPARAEAVVERNAPVEAAVVASPARAPARATPPVVLDPLPPLKDGPPTTWASSRHDDEPGWELASPPEAGSAFDDVLKNVRERPSFQPKPPPMHPQARALRGLGGLTLEPPGGDDDEDVEEQEG